MAVIKVSKEIWDSISESDKEKLLAILAEEGVISDQDEIVADASIDATELRSQLEEHLQGKGNERENEDCVDKCFAAALGAYNVCTAMGGSSEGCMLHADKLYTECIKYC
jgi:hypothetical protein